MELRLPQSTVVNKFIAKTKFYERSLLSHKLQQEFVQKIQKITWKFKLAENTLGVNKTDKVTEIQIFEIELKEKNIPKKVLKVIDCSIPYQILYKFIYKDNFSYGITLKENKVENYYFSEWNEEIIFDFTGVDLERIYQKLVKAFIKEEAQNKKDFSDAINFDQEIKSLEKEIVILQNKIQKEKQFNRKVELNKILLSKEKELKQITKDA